MPRPAGQLNQLRQYIEDLEGGVAMRLADLGARLRAAERDLAAMGKRLDSLGGSGPEAAGPSDDRENGGNGHG